MPTALITGIGGQDGSYLTEFLLGRGYRVIGTVPDDDPVNIDRVRHLLHKIEVVRDDLLDQDRIEIIFREHRPDEVYNFAANSVLAASFEQPILATMVLAMGSRESSKRSAKITPKARFFQASSSEIFGNRRSRFPIGHDPLPPRNPYGVSKVYGHLMAMTYRENYDLYACSGILYNHESPRRSPEFVTRKITRAAAMIKLGHSKELRLGNLDARRDWGYAGDYVRAMWLVRAATTPVLPRGNPFRARPAGGCTRTRLSRIRRPRRESFRPPETAQLVGNPEKAQRVLDWKREVSFRDLVRTMVDADLEALRPK
jgi:GDPmannose 4,6-dehydratase